MEVSRYKELGLASLFRAVLLGVRLLFAVVALLAFKGAEYNVYSENIALVSFLVVLSGAQLYTYNQKNSKGIIDYEKHRFTIYTLEFFICLVVCLVSWKYFNINYSLILFVLSELFSLELVRHHNFLGEFKVAQLYNLILRGFTPLLVVVFVYYLNLNINLYFVFLGIINLAIVLALLGGKLRNLRFVKIDFKNFIINILPLLMYAGFYRFLDVLLRDIVNGLSLSEVEINYVHLAVTILFILEGFCEQIILQPLRNRILKSPSYILPNRLFIGLVLVLLPIVVFDYNLIVTTVQTIVIFVTFRVINSLYVLLLMKSDENQYFIYTAIEAALFIIIVVYKIWVLMFFYLLIKMLFINRNFARDEK